MWYCVYCVLCVLCGTVWCIRLWLYPLTHTSSPTFVLLHSPHSPQHSPQHSPPSPPSFSLQWQLLFTGGHEVQCYDIEWDKVLVTMQKGWDAQEVLDFLLKQDVVVEVSESKRSKRSKECLCIKNYHCVLCCAVCVCVCVYAVCCALCVGKNPCVNL